MAISSARARGHQGDGIKESVERMSELPSGRVILRSVLQSHRFPVRGRSLRTKSSWLAGLSVASCLGLVLSAQLAHAQDAPAPEAPPADAPPVAALPASPASPPDAPSAAPSTPPPPSAPPDSAAPAPSAGSTPPAGSAAFAPLPDAPPEPPVTKAKHPNKTPATPPAESAPPLADTPTEAPAAAYHRGAPSSPQAAPEPEKTNDDEGLFGPFRIGFLIGTGLPDLLNLGGQIKLTRYFGTGVNVGIIPTVKLSFYGEAKLAYQEYDLYGHIYPFGGAFFLGAGVGYATMKGSLANSYPVPVPFNVAYGNSVAVDSQGSVRTLVLTPQIGLLKTFGPGFSIGLDVGAQVPIAPSKIDSTTHAPSFIPQDQIKPYDDKVRSTLTTIGRQVLPTFNFKIGWLL